ncbi:MAG: PhoX family phosphatase [Pigmentiphaga sp.]|nr:PhoX family phosphatase [Pigmentiphaga sp.]
MSAFDLDDLPTNPTQNTHFNDVVKRAVSRRGFMKTGLGLGALGFMGGTLAACGGSDDDGPSDDGGGATPPTEPLLGFAAVAMSTADTIEVPAGYRHQIITRWGDPLFANSPAWRGDARDDAAAQALQVGDNHDGMHFFPLRDGESEEGLLVMNHEYFNPEYFFPPEVEPGGANWSLDWIRKGQNAHGISVVHVRRQPGGEWQVVVPSRYNRRLHGNSPMSLTGPAAGHTLMQTKADPTGQMALGTLNNCGNGYTLWGTYLTCEENFNGYFGTLTEGDTRDANHRRYGLPAGRSGYNWEDLDERFDYKKEPNEANRFGWIVEIDPFDPSSTPKKRTALGRIKHENAAQTLAADNRVVVYMGDDQANDYVYKFVSDDKYVEGNMAANRNLLESGKLYVARFHDGAASGDMMGNGEWILLERATRTTDGRTLGDIFATQAELLIKTRLAADAVGATPMDRPEWVTVHPDNGDVYLTLTNNSSRKEGDTNDANPRAANVYGQIIRWREAGGDAAALTFEWDLYVLAGNPIVHATGLMKGSDNVTTENLFNSPDGLAFDADGRLWIQTDGNFSNAGAYAGMGNNQMLIGDPESGEIRRFLVGPSGCEVTGITWTPDQKTVFVNIQHPGEYGSHPRRPDVGPGQDALAFSKWPEASGGRPRSATVVIWKEDGGKVGT